MYHGSIVHVDNKDEPFILQDISIAKNIVNDHYPSILYLFVNI